MADAFDLGWKIEATLRGWGGPRLLDESYEIERSAAARDLLHYQGLDFSSGAPVQIHAPLPIYDAPGEPLWRAGAEGDAARRTYGEGLVASRGDEYDKPVIDLGYRYDGSPLLYDDGSPAPDRRDRRHYVQSAKPGGRAPHVALDSGRSTLDLFGRGFVLVRTDATVDPSSFESAARESGVPFRVETAPEAAAAYEAALTLVRPDGFSAWRGNAAPTDPRAVFDVVCGRR